MSVRGDWFSHALARLINYNGISRRCRLLVLAKIFPRDYGGNKLLAKFWKKRWRGGEGGGAIYYLTVRGYIFNKLKKGWSFGSKEIIHNIDIRLFMNRNALCNTVHKQILQRHNSMLTLNCRSGHITWVHVCVNWGGGGGRGLLKDLT